jgi:hypothetical protein
MRDPLQFGSRFELMVHSLSGIPYLHILWLIDSVSHSLMRDTPTSRDKVTLVGVRKIAHPVQHPFDGLSGALLVL